MKKLLNEWSNFKEKIEEQEEEKTKIPGEDDVDRPDDDQEVGYDYMVKKLDDASMETVSAKTENPDYLRAIAKAHGDKGQIRHNLAFNKNTPKDVLRQIAQKAENPMTINYLGKNPNTPPGVLTKLFQSGGKEVKISVLQNPNLPVEIVKSIAQDSDGDIARLAKRFLKKREGELEEISSGGILPANRNEEE